MKKRIIISSLITVVFALIIMTYSFIILVNISEINSTKEKLRIYNDIIIGTKNFSEKNIKLFSIKKIPVRFIVVNRDEKVTYDSDKLDVGKHLQILNLEDAFNKGEESILKYSTKYKENIAYYVTKINDDSLLISSVPILPKNVIPIEYVKYYILIMLLVILLSLIVSLKLVKGVIYPLKELEFVTSKIANGDLNKRAIISSDNEISSLAKTFNNMANQLQQKIDDSIDKQNKLEAILESMESGVIAIDDKRRVILINPYAKKMFDINEKIIGEDISNYIIDYEILEFINGFSLIEAREVKLFHPIERYIKIRKVPIINTRRYPRGIVITIQDITDIKRLETMRSEFVANVSHELKTPLTSIKGFAETLKFVEDDFTRNKFLNIIDSEAERLTRLIDDILVLSRIENNNVNEEEEFRISDIVKDVINMVMIQAERKGIDIQYKYDKNLFLIGDKYKFIQLVLNLVDNAVKYSEDNKKITIKTYNEGDYNYMEVKDEGIGIPKEDLPRIFERFYRVDKSRTKGGTGLGLAIVKHIVKTFNGQINVESKLGDGTRFIVKFKKDNVLKECEC